MAPCRAASRVISRMTDSEKCPTRSASFMDSLRKPTDGRPWAFRLYNAPYARRKPNMSIPTPTLLDRFCRYCRVHTEAVEGSGKYPSSPGQLELGKMLLGELREIGLADARQSEHGIVTATVPATAPGKPTIAWIAHVDTSPETTGKNVKPTIHKNYDGKDVALPGD